MSYQLVNYIIEDRFERLRPYLDGISTEDLMNGLVSIEDILEATKSVHRLLMIVFIKKYLIPLRRSDSTQSTKVFHEGHLNLRGKIATEELKESSWLSTVKDIPKLPEVITNPDAVVSMDLSHNYLSNKDLNAVPSLLETDLKSCLIIDLSNNRLNAGDDGLEALRRILKIEDIKVIICSNALVVEGKQFLSSLSNNELGKLIWIPRQWYTSLGWHNAIDEDKWDIVYQTHYSFYNTPKI
jgi:hypothetical protein